MQHVNVISNNGDNKTLSLSSAAVSITESLMKPEYEQTKKVSAASENVPTIKKRPNGSMPNISASITNGDDTAAIEAPTAAVAVQQVSAESLEYCPGSIELANYAGPQEMRYEIGLVNAAVVVPPAAAGEDEIRSPSVTSDRQVSAAEPKHDGSGESDAKIRGFAGLRPRLWCSMPNIAIHYTDKVFYNTAEIECIAQMPVSPDSLTDSSITAVTEPADVTPVKIKRCSLWKRSKKFARRVFCCGAA